MTCIAAYVDDFTVHIAADSCASDETSVETRVETKVWYADSGDWVMASMPSFRVMQILRYEMDPTKILGKPSKCTISDIVNKFIPELKLRVQSEPHPSLDFNILLGGMGKLWLIDADYAVNAVKDYIAMGSGAEYALGSLYTNIRVGASNPRNLVKEAVWAACQFSTSCSPPVIYRGT